MKHIYLILMSVLVLSCATPEIVTRENPKGYIITQKTEPSVQPPAPPPVASPDNNVEWAWIVWLIWSVSFIALLFFIVKTVKEFKK